ncbi:MAG: hypothetical protein AAFP13_01600 [Pseudomonadota bacterium]
MLEDSDIMVAVSGIGSSLTAIRGPASIVIIEGNMRRNGKTMPGPRHCPNDTARDLIVKVTARADASIPVALLQKDAERTAQAKSCGG